MIRTLSANTVEEALKKIRDDFSSEVTIISILDTNQGVSVRFHTNEIFLASEEKQKIEDFLVKHKISDNVRSEILKNLAEGVYGYETSTELLIARIFQLNPLNLQKYQKSNPLILVGYSGVGKTHFAMKCAYHVIKNGGNAHVITSDVLKPGGIEEIKTLAQKARIPFSVAINAQDIWVMCQNIKPNTTIIVDTPSLQMRDTIPLRLVQDIQSSVSGAFLWVERSGYDFLDYEDHYQNLGLEKLEGVALTQTDLSPKSSGLLEFAHKHRVALKSFSAQPFSLESQEEAFIADEEVA